MVRVSGEPGSGLLLEGGPILGGVERLDPGELRFVSERALRMAREIVCKSCRGFLGLSGAEEQERGAIELDLFFERPSGAFSSFTAPTIELFRAIGAPRALRRGDPGVRVDEVLDAGA